MRSLGLLGVLGIVGCESDATVKVFNATPEAAITSHENGAEVKEATEVLFRGAGSDPDHDQTELEGSWQNGATILCDWSPLDEDGVSECTVLMTTDFAGRLMALLRAATVETFKISNKFTRNSSYA